MILITAISQHVSSTVIKLPWIVLVATLLFLCCSSLNANPIDELEQLDEHSMSEYIYPTAMFVEDSNVVERAAPRFGRAAPRYGRAAPRFGRLATPLLISRMNHAGRYHLDDDEDDSKADFPLETESWILGKRAAPRFGRSI